MKKSLINPVIELFSDRVKNGTFRKNILFISFITILSTSLLSYNIIGKTYSYNIGDIAGSDIRVPWDIEYNLENQTEIEKKRAVENVPPVFDMNKTVLDEKTKEVNLFFSYLKNFSMGDTSGSSTDLELKIQPLSESLPENMKFDKNVLLPIITYGNLDTQRRAVVETLNDIYQNGVLEEKYDNPLNIQNTDVSMRTISSEFEYVEDKRRLENIRTLEKAQKDCEKILSKYAEHIPDTQKKALTDVTKNFLVQNLNFNADETKRRHLKATESVKTVKGHLKKDQIIVREGDAITVTALEMIKVLNEHANKIHFTFIIGVFLFQIIFFSIFALFFNNLKKVLAPDSKAPIIIMLLLLIYIMYTFLIFRTGDFKDSSVIFTLFLPIPFITMMLTILYSSSMALLVGSYAVFFTVTLTRGNSMVLVLAISSALISIFSTKNIERRIDFLKIGFILGALNSLVIVAIGLMEEFSVINILANIRLSFIFGFGNTIGVMGLFPFFENLFGFTTKFKLMELADLNSPIFKKMLIKAPGTYNHSIIVANLAEAACKEIGADHLLARVGSYYHDIGKIDNPRIFIENKADNVKINLSPYEYCAKIIAHVEKGVALAKEMKLPQSIIDFIQEHHGDGLVVYFYHQALEESQQRGVPVNPDDFRYPGPKPQSKETVIVMLADAIEAASRTLKEPSYVKLETMVKKLIYNKFNEGELEFSDLTMKDINDIQKAFLQVLNGIYHSRIEYPEKEEIEKLEKMNRQNGVSIQ